MLAKSNQIDDKVYLKKELDSFKIQNWQLSRQKEFCFVISGQNLIKPTKVEWLRMVLPVFKESSKFHPRTNYSCVKPVCKIYGKLM